MSVYDEIKRLKSEITKLNKKLADVRARIERTQDEALKRVYKQDESDLIDDIDEMLGKVDELEKDLPEKRTNGHHKPENLEDERLEIDYKPDDNDLNEN